MHRQPIGDMSRDMFIERGFKNDHKTFNGKVRDARASTELLLPTRFERVLAYCRSLADEHGWLKAKNVNRAANSLNISVDEVNHECSELTRRGLLKASTMEKARYQVS